MTSMGSSTIFWFRKSLRLHDNPALLATLEAARESSSSTVYLIFILDPHFHSKSLISPNRWRFLFESLHDINRSLVDNYGSRLLVLRGSVIETLTHFIDQWHVTTLGFELDTEPYALQRDSQVQQLCLEKNVTCITRSGHTLYDLNQLKEKQMKKTGGSPLCITYTSMLTLIINKTGPPEKPKDVPTRDQLPSTTIVTSDEYTIPTLDEMHLITPPLPSLFPQSPAIGQTEQGMDEKPSKKPTRLPFSSDHNYFIGGEREALRRLDVYMCDHELVRTFRKPQTSAVALVPSTTALSPYLKFGCLSPRTFWHAVQTIIQKAVKEKQQYSRPPESLHGQLYWREFFYYNGYTVPNFDRMVGNPICKQIPYKYARDSREFKAWRDGKTGFPWIDACMIQLQQHGWMHHLARHAVACFLTRGDLFLHWELGRDVFDELLVDADWSLNNGNWLWLSASAFFQQYWRVYSPVKFPVGTFGLPATVAFIRHFLPILRSMPDKYLLEPWKAPPSVQKAASCIIGRDYPMPIFTDDHTIRSKQNMTKMKQAYADHTLPSISGTDEETSAIEPPIKRRNH